MPTILLCRCLNLSKNKNNIATSVLVSSAVYVCTFESPWRSIPQLSATLLFKYTATFSRRRLLGSLKSVPLKDLTSPRLISLSWITPSHYCSISALSKIVIVRLLSTVCTLNQMKQRAHITRKHRRTCLRTCTSVSSMFITSSSRSSLSATIESLRRRRRSLPPPFSSSPFIKRRWLPFPETAFALSSSHICFQICCM